MSLPKPLFTHRGTLDRQPCGGQFNEVAHHVGEDIIVNQETALPVLCGLSRRVFTAEEGGLEVFEIPPSLFHFLLFGHLVVMLVQHVGGHVAPIRDYCLRHVVTE